MEYIYNTPRFEQASLRKGSESLGIASTDIDLAIDLGDRAYIFVELKTTGTSLKASQRMLINRLVKASTKPIFTVVASHDTTPDMEICPNAVVEEVYWNTGEGLEYYGFDLDADGDLISLNHFVSTLAYYICPRLLQSKAELVPWDSYGPLDDMLKPWTVARGEEDGLYPQEPNLAYQDWQKEVDARESKIGTINQAPAFSDYPSGWPNESDIRMTLTANAKDADGKYWWQKYLNG